MMSKSMVISFVVLGLSGLATPALSDTLVFEDNFDGPEVDPSVWGIELNGGDVHIEGGWMHLDTAGDQVVFPFVYTLENQFPEGSFRYEVRMAYDSATNYGVGNVCSDSLVCGRPYEFMDQFCFVIWQDWAHHFVYDYANQVYYAPAAFDYSPHTYSFQVDGGWCQAYMDGDLLGSAFANRRPEYVMFGNNYDPQSHPEAWSSIRVDYVRIWTIMPTSAEACTWSRIKGLYR